MSSYYPQNLENMSALPKQLNEVIKNDEMSKEMRKTNLKNWKSKIKKEVTSPDEIENIFRSPDNLKKKTNNSFKNYENGRLKYDVNNERSPPNRVSHSPIYTPFRFDNDPFIKWLDSETMKANYANRNSMVLPRMPSLKNWSNPNLKVKFAKNQKKEIKREFNRCRFIKQTNVKSQESKIPWINSAKINRTLEYSKKSLKAKRLVPMNRMNMNYKNINIDTERALEVNHNKENSTSNSQIKYRINQFILQEMPLNQPNSRKDVAKLNPKFKAI